MTSTPFTRALDDAVVHYRVAPDANINSEGTSEQLSPLMPPLVEVNVYTVSGNADQTLLAITPHHRDLNLAKLDAGLADPPFKGVATPIDELSRPDLLATWAENKWPVDVDTGVDTGVANARSQLRIPGGKPDESIVIYGKHFFDVMGARIEDIALPQELHHEEPYFALYSDGIRALDQDTNSLLIPAIEVYFDELLQMMSIGESDEFIEVFRRTIAAAKRLSPRPSEWDISQATTRCPRSAERGPDRPMKAVARSPARAR